MRYFVYLSFNGANYHGWQRQPNSNSVQQTLEEALSTILRTDVCITGAGRTDAGVHAKLMVAHFDTQSPLQDTKQLVHRLNKLLPSDIAVKTIIQVSDYMHARFSAVSRTYNYYIHTRKDPFRNGLSWCVTFPLDFRLMNEAAKVLLEYEDFSSFCKTHTDVKTSFCNVTKADWEEVEPGCWRFAITANRFLRNMVRAIVGTLIEVGRERMTVEQFRQVIVQKNRCSAGESVPGYALFLVDVQYPEEL